MRFLLLLLLSATLPSLSSQPVDYQNHIAPDRLIIIFNKKIAAERKEEIIRASGLVTHSVNLPHPELTICFVTNREKAEKYFAALTEVKFISFFLSDGTHYAGVLDDFFVKLKDKNFEPLLREKLKTENLGEPIPDKYVPNLYSIRNSKFAIRNTLDVCASFKSQGWVEYATPNYLFNPLVTSNDQYYPRQWNIANTGTPVQGSGTPDADMDVDSAWTISEGDSTIKIGLIDSGVDTLHTDLRPNLLPGHDAVGDTTDGYPTPVYPEDGHGTCCAGILAAVKDNSFGIAGVAPQCKVIPVRSFYYIELSPGNPPVPFSTAAIFADAIGWAWSTAGADILSNSWGLPASLISLLAGGTQPVDDAIQQAYVNGRNGKGIAMFFSSGNEEDSTGPIWPGSLAQTIAINATSMCDERKNANDCSTETWSGNWGNGLDFSAPGVKITTTDMRGAKGFSTNDYTFTFNGTSAACPNAAAVGALLLSIRPDLHAEDIRHIIAATCDKVGGYAYNSTLAYGSWSRELGYGRVNAYSALQYAPTYSGIDDVKQVSSYKVYPNPSSGAFVIDYDGLQSGTAKLYDLSGKLLTRTSLAKGSNPIQLPTLPIGLYVLEIDNQEGRKTEKISVIR